MISIPPLMCPSQAQRWLNTTAYHWASISGFRQCLPIPPCLPIWLKLDYESYATALLIQGHGKFCEIQLFDESRIHAKNIVKQLADEVARLEKNTPAFEKIVF
jgi:hypothetical protein